jgi:hypothetical protein
VGPRPENVYIFEAPGLHLWRFLNQIHKRIGSKLTVFYKNGYHFTKLTPLLRKFYLKISTFNDEFKLIFTLVSQLRGGGLHPHTPARYVPESGLNSSTLVQGVHFGIFETQKSSQSAIDSGVLKL